MRPLRDRLNSNAMPVRANIVRACLCLLAARFALGGGLECQLRIADPNVFRVAQLRGDQQRLQLRALLIASNGNTSENVFHYADELRPALIGLLPDPEVGGTAARFLALIGEPEDLRVILRSPPQTKKGPVFNGWAAQVSAALFDPTSDEEWSFLESGVRRVR